MLMGHIYAKKEFTKMVRQKNPSDFWGGHFMVPKLGGQLLKKKLMQFTGHFCGWMISLGEYHLPYAQTIETSCL
jgi:hypothetical protein